MENKLAGTLRWLLILSMPALFLTCTGCRTAQTADTSTIKIGSPQGAGGLLVSYAAAKIAGKTEITPFLEISPIRDCCSSYAQMALSSQSVDAAVVCVDAAKSLIEKDDRYVTIGPCLANSDLLVVRGNPDKTQKIGVSQDHLYQETIIDNLLGTGHQSIPMASTALAYAYEKGDVDGVVTDIEEALKISGTKLSSGGNKGDVITYVLVARKNLPGLTKLVTAFSEAASDLNNSEKLQQAIVSYNSYPTEGEEAAQWISHNVRFIAPK
jgi:hypothetical protein